jgi:Protein of unknown function (DUF2889)
MVDGMSWPTELDSERYPGTVRREISVEATVEDGCLVFTAVLRDRWLGEDGAEEEIHGYEVRLRAEPPDLTVRSVDVRPRHLPFPECPAAALAAQRLVGLRLTKGFRAGATEALGGVEGCTHLLTLVLAIWNQQVVTQYMLTRTDDGSHPEDMPDFERIVGACSGWREGGAAIRLVRDRQPLPRSVDYGGSPPARP